MIELTPTFSGSDLKRGAIYQIEGYLYQYLYPDPFARIEHPRFQFRCLAGQKKKADLTLNKNNIRKAYHSIACGHGAQLLPCLYLYAHHKTSYLARLLLYLFT